MGRASSCCCGLLGLVVTLLAAGILACVYWFNQDFPQTPISPVDAFTKSDKFFTAVFYTMSTRQEPGLAPWRQELFEEIKGEVVEIGPGFGANFEYMAGPEVDSVTVFEPNLSMHPGLRRKAEEVGLGSRLKVVSSLDEIKDHAFDFAVSTLVLCTVPDPPAAVANIQRWLKPGGTFVFLEHVALPEGSPGRFVQEFIQPVWGWVGDGCVAARETWVTLDNQAGWTVTYHWEEMGPMPLIVGKAVVPAQ